MKKELIPLILLTFVNTLNFSIMIPILPFIVNQYGGGIIMYGVLLSMYPLFQFFAAPMLGTLSDFYGRRPILLLSQAGTMLSWVIFAASYFVPNSHLGFISLPLLVLLLARIADGATGGNNAVANAFLSDITTPEEKTKTFGMMGGIVGLGFVIGPAIGGLTMATPIGYLAPILLTLFISVITLIAMHRYLPESLDKKDRAKELKFNWIEELQFLPKIKKYSHNRQIKYLFFLRIMFLFVFSSSNSIFVLYMINSFNLNSQQIGLLFMVIGVFLFLNQAFLSGRISKKFGDLKTLIIGQSTLVVSQFLYVFVPSLLAFAPVMYLNNLGFSISMPTFKSLISKSVDRKKQGEIMGIDESLFAISAAISPLLATWVYSVIGKYTFAVQAIVLLATVIVFEYKKGWKRVAEGESVSS